MGSRVTRVVDILPAKFQLPMPSVLDLGSGTGQTDGQTDNGLRCIMPPSYEGGA